MCVGLCVCVSMSASLCVYVCVCVCVCVCVMQMAEAGGGCPEGHRGTDQGSQTGPGLQGRPDHHSQPGGECTRMCAC